MKCVGYSEKAMEMLSYIHSVICEYAGKKLADTYIEYMDISESSLLYFSKEDFKKIIQDNVFPEINIINDCKLARMVLDPNCVFETDNGKLAVIKE